MGWWTQDRKGNTFSREPRRELIWGDTPADIFGDAVAEIRKAFIEFEGREPRMEELRAGLEFTLRREPDEASAAVLD